MFKRQFSWSLHVITPVNYSEAYRGKIQIYNKQSAESRCRALQASVIPKNCVNANPKNTITALGKMHGSEGNRRQTGSSILVS